jgi:hypothetical protein
VHSLADKKEAKKLSKDFEKHLPFSKKYGIMVLLIF